jgi:copper chaperone
MIAFRIDDMTCGHCVATITKAVQQTAPGATVAADLQQHRVTIASDTGDAQAFADAITQAGYTPVPEAVEAAAPARSGGCGGGCGCSRA